MKPAFELENTSLGNRSLIEFDIEFKQTSIDVTNYLQGLPTTFEKLFRDYWAIQIRASSRRRATQN